MRRRKKRIIGWNLSPLGNQKPIERSAYQHTKSTHFNWNKCEQLSEACFVSFIRCAGSVSSSDPRFFVLTLFTFCSLFGRSPSPYTNTHSTSFYLSILIEFELCTHTHTRTLSSSSTMPNVDDIENDGNEINSHSGNDQGVLIVADKNGNNNNNNN